VDEPGPMLISTLGSESALTVIGKVVENEVVRLGALNCSWKA